MLDYLNIIQLDLNKIRQFRFKLIDLHELIWINFEYKFFSQFKSFQMKY